MSRACLDWDHPVHLDTFAHIRIEIERNGRYSHWSFRCPGYIHSLLRSHYKYLAEKMVTLSEYKRQTKEDRMLFVSCQWSVAEKHSMGKYSRLRTAGSKRSDNRISDLGSEM